VFDPEYAIDDGNVNVTIASTPPLPCFFVRRSKKNPNVHILERQYISPFDDQHSCLPEIALLC